MLYCNRENMQKLVAALRSGEFTQTQRVLRREDKYCCLGVACELYRRETVDAPSWIPSGSGFAFAGLIGSLPAEVGDWLGLRDHGDIPLKAQTALPSAISMNDVGVPFPEIANALEATYLSEPSNA